MKKFDLESALNGVPVCTGEGKKVIDMCFFKNLPFDSYCISYVLEGDRVVRTSGISGSFYIPGKESQFDLFMAPVKVEKWINLFKNNKGVVFTSNVFLMQKRTLYYVRIITRIILKQQK